MNAERREEVVRQAREAHARQARAAAALRVAAFKLAQWAFPDLSVSGWCVCVNPLLSDALEGSRPPLADEMDLANLVRLALNLEDVK